VEEYNDLGKVVYYLNKEKQINGTYTQFHHNGNLYWEAVFKDGLKEGHVKYFDSLGNIIQEVNYKNGELDGESMTFYSNGKVEWMVNYSLGKKVKNSYKYYPSGFVEIERRYENDSLIHESEFDSLGKFYAHKIFVKSDTITTLDSMKFSVKVLNPLFNNIALEILSLDKSNHTDTLFQNIVEDTQYEATFPRSEIIGKDIILSVYEIDSLNIVRGIEKIKYKLY
jgi:hypothetical protein